MFLTLLLLVINYYVIHPIHLFRYVLRVYIHPLMNKTSYYLEIDKSDGSYL